ncbi:vicilin-like seed storage protein At2g18540 isoform X4 [Penaeus chinensis]|uniref:vicilin-like seed storage protein At2g18540 isoform X4 n=1 Tax=Penaeus chinensis TaxID=139456 RepID=UPI001FB59DB5|nr:vicilin-like seed storage protein At2g18540 isoform X4 [Penaeus chinensis]
MLALALLSFCAAGWAAAAPRDEDLRASVVFNQLAIAQVLDNLSNISQGLARVTSSLEILSQALTSHLQQDDVINREFRICTNISEALQTRIGLNENQFREQQEANAQLEAKRREAEERIRQARITKQQLQQQLLQLQTDELQLKHEEVQAKTENLEAKRAQGEKARQNSEISLLKHELLLAKERNRHIETQISSIRQKVTQVTRAKNELTQSKDTKADVKSSLSQNLEEEVTLIERHSDENSRLEEDIGRTRATGENLTKTKSELEQKLNALNVQKGQLQKGMQLAGESEKSVQASIARVGQEIQKIKSEIRYTEGEMLYC